ncbi:hypothetical protein D8S82_03300 [Mycobacterium hodleri]|uniref:Uncharacterized protein n=1 Tax=Mycolicibacterium hodleri TaxID=49897 RepID=A0A544W7B2_9MYCO|nr:hypothetical protein [Mycolicibacterium hodleri]TQR88099.1 hypothetical protein D8S82_03300 [Mycolicibacterium hodleri]
MTGVRFKETMTGRVALKSTDPVAGYAATSAFAMSMRASIETGNVAEFVGRAVPTARLRAEMVIPVVGGRFVSTHGTFELFRSGPGLDGKPARMMVYTAELVNDDRRIRMCATKYLQPSWHPWGDSTTAHVTLTEISVRADGARPWCAAGLIKISPRNFLVQLTTMRGFGEGSTWKQRRRAVLTYADFFVRGLLKTYLQRVRW